MKKIFTVLVVLTSISNTVYAQDSPSENCRIWYNYDANGQRIKRYYECKSLSDEAPYTNPRIRITTFPNPTDGHVNVVADLMVDELLTRILTIDGALITTASCTECNHVALDITNQTQGSYIIQTIATKQDYEDINESHTLIKVD